MEARTLDTASLLNGFLAYRATAHGETRALAPSSRMAYQKDIKLFMDYLNDKRVNLEEVTDDDFIMFFKERGYASSSARRAVISIASAAGFFDYLKSQHGFEIPTEFTALRRIVEREIKKGARLMRTIDEETFGKFISCLGARDCYRDVRNALSAVLFMRTGISSQQLIRLHERDLFRFSDKDDNVYVKYQNNKGKDVVRSFMPATYEGSLIAGYRGRLERLKAERGVDNDLLIVTGFGLPFDETRSFRRSLEHACKMAEVDVFNQRDLHRTWLHNKRARRARHNYNGEHK